jgi:transcriptional regulator with GAF, ATPase, and Fis domain
MEPQDEERTIVVSTLERTGWNVTKSARLLGLTRDMMRYRIEKLGLSRPPEESGPVLRGS